MSDFVTPWTAARQASLSITDSQSLLKLMSITSVMPSNHLILCHPLLLLPSTFPSIRFFSSLLIQPYVLGINATSVHLNSYVHSLSHVRLLLTSRTAVRQDSLFITNSQSLLKLMSITSVMPFNYLILCLPLLLLPSIFPSIRVFSMSWFFASGGQSIGVPALASVFPMNIQD